MGHGDGVKTDHSRSIKNYLQQPSTWLGLVKMLIGGALIVKGVDPAAAGAVIGVLGAVDVGRKEQV